MAYGKFSAYDIFGYSFKEKASYVICTVPGINHPIWKSIRYKHELDKLYEKIKNIREDKDLESYVLLTKQAFLDNPDLNTIRLLSDERTFATYFKPKLRPTELTERSLINSQTLVEYKISKDSYANYHTIGCLFVIQKQAKPRKLNHKEFFDYYNKKSIVLDQLAIDKAIQLDSTTKQYINNYEYKKSDYIKNMFKMTLHSKTGPVKYINSKGYMIIRKEGAFWLVHNEARYKRLRKKTTIEKKIKIQKDKTNKLEKPDISLDLLYNIIYILRNAVAGSVHRGGYNLSDGQSRGKWNAINEIIIFYPVVEYLLKSKTMVKKMKGLCYGKQTSKKLHSIIRELKTHNLEYTWKMITKSNDQENTITKAKKLSKDLINVLHWKKKDYLIHLRKLKAKAAKISLKSSPKKK